MSLEHNSGIELLYDLTDSGNSEIGHGLWREVHTRERGERIPDRREIDAIRCGVEYFQGAVQPRYQNVQSRECSLNAGLGQIACGGDRSQFCSATAEMSDAVCSTAAVSSPSRAAALIAANSRLISRVRARGAWDTWAIGTVPL